MNLCAARQANGENGELTHKAIDLDRAAMLLCHDIVADRETKAGSLSGRFGRKERLEQFVSDLGRDAGAIVPHLHFDRIAELARFYSQCWPEI